MDEFEFNCVIGAVDMPVTITFTSHPEYEDPEVLKAVVRIEGLDYCLIEGYLLDKAGLEEAMGKCRDHIKELQNDADDHATYGYQ